MSPRDLTLRFVPKFGDAPADEREQRLFQSLAGSATTIRARDLIDSLEAMGLQLQDPRVKPLIRDLDKDADLDFEAFCALVRPCILLVERALTGRMVIPDFATFRGEVARIFEEVRAHRGGAVADYIPQLSRVDPEHWAVSVCTVDGQRADFGDCDVDYCAQSTCKPINYCLALEEHGEDLVHKHVGREPSGHSFNELTLDKRNRPHNPMINAGAIMCCSLIRPRDNLAERFEYVMNQWRRFCSAKVGFSNSVYLSERQTADRNFALGYFMQEHKAFPRGTELISTLEFYFQCCSIELTTRKMSVLAATLANGGVNPISGERVVSPRTVRNVLSLMYTCGMYDFSGEYAFTIGLPAKSGVAGAVMVVVPNVCGFVTWSPRLDELGNSVRGISFARELVRVYNFHNYDNLTGLTEKRDPRVSAAQQIVDALSPVMWAASKGDVSAIRRLVARGAPLDAADYDRRTPLHLAASEGHLKVVKLLVDQGVPVAPVDRWGGTPLDDARRHGHEEVAAWLEGQAAGSQTEG